MVDTARALLDELMGRNRNQDPTSKSKQLNWEDTEFCQYYLVKFCPHDLFVNTRADLGQCPKLHDDEAKRLFDEARQTIRKRQYEDEFLRFCSNMINEVDRKIQKGKQRLLLMNNKEGSGGGSHGTHTVYNKHQEQINILNDRIKKLVGEAEEAGHRGDVDQAQGLMKLCDKLKEEKDALIKAHEGSHWSVELAQAQEKQMEVCEVCGAFLIVGDAQQRIDDHLTGKQHLGYSRLRKAVDEMYENRRKEREGDDRRRDDDRKHRSDSFVNDRHRRDERQPPRRQREEFDDRRNRRDDQRGNSGGGIGNMFERGDRSDRGGRDNRGDRRGGGSNRGDFNKYNNDKNDYRRMERDNRGENRNERHRNDRDKRNRSRSRSTTH